VAVTVATDNLAAGVAVGVLLSGVFFTFKVSRLLHVVTRAKTASTPGLPREPARSSSRRPTCWWTPSTCATSKARPCTSTCRRRISGTSPWNALDKVCQRLRKHGSVVEVSGLNQASQDLILQLDAAPD
jgi:SulP family sulfate permease